MMRALRIFGMVILVGIVLVVALLGYLAYTRFYRYQAAVDRIYRSIPADEMRLSAAARDVFKRLESEETITWIVSRSLIDEIAPGRVGMGEWHVRGAIWTVLLPYRFDAEERLLLYLHYLAFEGGRGIGGGARKYFGKSPAQLTAPDALILLTISRSPQRYSPSLQPERFREMLRHHTRRY